MIYSCGHIYREPWLAVYIYIYTSYLTDVTLLGMYIVAYTPGLGKQYVV